MYGQDFSQRMIELAKEKILIGDVAFETRAELEKCKADAGNEWDVDEIYFVIDKLKKDFPNLVYNKKTFCSGVIKISR